MAKKRRKTTPKTESVGSSYRPSSAQALGTFAPGVLNMPRAGVHVPNQELKQVMGLLSGFGEAYSSITKSIRGDGSSNLGNLRRDGAEDMNWYKAEFESGRAAIPTEEGGTSLQDELFQLVELHGNPSAASHAMAMGIAAETLGAEISDKGHLLPNDQLTQPEIDAYLNTMLEGTAAAFRSHYSGFAEERKVLYNDGIVSDLVFAADGELKSNNELWKEVKADHENWLMDPGNKELYMLGLTVNAVQQATAAGHYERAEKLMTRLPEGYGARKGLDAKLIEGRRETAMTSLGEELTGLTASNYASWSMSDDVFADISNAGSDPRDTKFSTRLVDTLEHALAEGYMAPAKQRDFLRRFQSQTDSEGNPLFPRASVTYNKINDLRKRLPDEYDLIRQREIHHTQDNHTARQLILQYLDPDGGSDFKTDKEIREHLITTYPERGHDYAYELLELKKKRGGLVPDSSPKVYAQMMMRIHDSNVHQRRVLPTEIWNLVGEGTLTATQGNLLISANSLETKYEDEKFSPEAVELFDQIENAFWTAAGAEPPTMMYRFYTPSTDTDPGVYEDWVKLNSGLRKTWRSWVAENQVLRETDPSKYLEARTKKLLEISELYLAPGDNPIAFFNKFSATSRGLQWSSRENN